MLPVLGAQIAVVHGGVVGAGSGDVAEWKSVANNYLDDVVSRKLTHGRIYLPLLLNL